MRMGLHYSLAVAAAAIMTGCEATEVRRPTIWPLTTLPAGPLKQPSSVAVYPGQAPRAVVKVATIDSFAAKLDKDPTAGTRQLSDVQEKAASVGADAVIELRKQELKSTGFEKDPNTPFLSWRQGKGTSTFLRGTAVVYTK